MPAHQSVKLNTGAVMPTVGLGEPSFMIDDNWEAF